MQRIWQFLTQTTSLVVIGFLALAAFLFLGANTLQVAAIWVGVLMALALLAWAVAWFIKRERSKRAGEQLGHMLEQQADKPEKKSSGAKREEMDAVRSRMLEAIGTIKTSKLGLSSGAAALYELPWYMVIGNPAAGKSTAVANSGLGFPLADKNGKIIQGIGGTRNCDWFFTADGILLDTAGRYSVYEEDRAEWFGFLGLLKKYRARAPINGIIIAVSVAELTGNRPEFGINLAKNLRQRVQELTEKLEVFAPVYVVFTKVDLIAGFSEFFSEMGPAERDRAWGATLPYKQRHSGQEILAFFDAQFDVLYGGLKDISLASMAMNRGERMPPGVLTFPVEFLSVKGALRSFVATLFEENPYQFKPVFRGFYFTSAVQEGASLSASSERIANRFNLQLVPSEQLPAASQRGFFLRDLFKSVIFADKDLVAQYASRTKMRLRYATFFAAVACVGLALGGWTWSYWGNKQLVENVTVDMNNVIKIQEGKVDLQSRFAALEILQDRIEQLERYRTDRPLALGFGLYQGDMLERKLKEEYFSGIREIMLKPVAATIETYLTEVNAGADKLEPTSRPQAGGTAKVGADGHTGGVQPYKDVSTTSIEDAYNGLKTYLMLGDRDRVEPSHLNDQLTRFWRQWLESNRGAMPREQMIRSAERLIGFALTQVSDPSWPILDVRLSLVDQSRENLRRVVRGMPAIERVYADVRARASTRFPAMTVARMVGEQDKELVAGSYAIPGTFTRDAWDKFIEEAFKDASTRELQRADWVLKTSSKDDLTLEGSPEQIQKTLVAQYKTEYAAEWSKFLQGVTVADMGGFDSAVVAMNRLGDPQTSPINKIVKTVYAETSWDNPSLINEGLMRAQGGIIGWFKETILRQKPSQLNINMGDNKSANGSSAIPMGPVGKEFAGIAKLVVVKDKEASLMLGYMEALSKLRSRFNQIKNQGDTGPGAKQLMQQTLEGSGSELAEALAYVDSQMLVGMSDSQKTALRPLLVRPLMQAFTVIIKPTESEVNNTWRSQVYEPFQKTLAGKYPFAADSKIEAGTAEIGAIFGAEGAVAKFVNTSMGPLVVRRGDALAPKTWANMGVTLSPILVANFSRWVAPLGSGGSATAAGGGADAQTVFQIQPLPAPGTTEYTIDIDGQQLRYRNTKTQWTNFVWPNAQGVPGARITAVTFDGRTIEIANQPGRFGLERLINSAVRKRKDGGIFELTWSNGNISTSVDLKIISSPQVAGNQPASEASNGAQNLRSMKLPEIIVGNGTPEEPATGVATAKGATP